MDSAPAPAQAPVKAVEGAKVTLYWLEKSRAQRILWLLEELGINYDIKTFKRAERLAPPELKKIHPLGKSPIITVESDATKEPIVIAESANIIEYLIEHFGPSLVPTQYREGMEGKIGGETEEWLRYRYFMHYGEGTLMPYLVLALVMDSIKTSSPFLIKPITNAINNAVNSKFLSPNLHANYSLLESQFASSPQGGPFLCGAHLTGADILVSFPVSAARSAKGGLTEEKYPKLWAWVDMLESREAFKRGVAKIVEVEGKYDASL